MHREACIRTTNPTSILNFHPAQISFSPFAFVFVSVLLIHFSPIVKCVNAHDLDECIFGDWVLFKQDIRDQVIGFSIIDFHIDFIQTDLEMFSRAKFADASILVAARM